MRLLCLYFLCHVYKVQCLNLDCAYVCVIRYCTCAVEILAKVMLRAHRANVLWCTSGIASYDALKKQTFMKPWYCLSVQSHVSYFAKIMCQLCLFCELHPLHHPLHSCPCPPNSLSSVFLLCSILSPCLPPIFVLSLVVIWLSCYYTLMNLVIAFLAYCWCNYCIVCMYELHGTVVSVHAVYSTVRTVLGVSLPYRVHVHAAWYGSFSTPGVATVPFVPCLVSH